MPVATGTNSMDWRLSILWSLDLGAWSFRALARLFRRHQRALDHLCDDFVGGDFLGFGFVGEPDAMAQNVGGELLHE